MRSAARPILPIILLTLAACGRDASGPPEPAVEPAQVQAYARPPEIVEVRRAPGGFIVRGRAQPQTRVRALDPSGRSFGATADEAGRFALTRANGGAPVVLALSAETGRHAAPAEGWLFVPPDHPERAVLLRAGAPARPIDPRAGLVAAIDYDAAGGAAVSGVAAAGATVEVQVDSGLPAKARADARGIWGRSLGDEGRLPPGPHRLTVSSPAGAEHRTVDFVAGSPGAAFRAVREAAGWRVHWSPPGGGAQSTFIFTPPTAS